MVIPGNPGHPDFYEAFAGHLRAHGHEVLVSPHPPPSAAAPIEGLRAHAEHHARTVRAHLAATGAEDLARRLVLVGHSVGAYLVYLIVTYDLLPVTRVCLLFPFLARPRWTGRLLLWALGRRLLVAATLAAFHALPARWQRWCLARAGAGVLAPTAQRMLESPAQVQAAVAMAALERAEIVPRPDAAYLNQHPLLRSADRCLVLLCAADPWAPAPAVAPLEGEVYRAPPPMGHAFVVDADQTRQVAERLHRFLGAPPTTARSSSVARSRT